MGSRNHHASAGLCTLWLFQKGSKKLSYILKSLNGYQVAVFNASVFFLSVVAFISIMVPNAIRRGELIAGAVRLPLPGCPVINGGTGWALWIPGEPPQS